MCIVSQLLASLPGVNAWQRRFVVHLLSLWPCVAGRFNFLHLSRHSLFCERSFRRHFARPFPWGHFNRALIQRHTPCGARLMLAYDHTFVPKSGQATPGLDWFYNGALGHTQRGLELGLLAIVNLDTRTAYALHAKQSPAAKDTKDAKDAKDAPECKSVAHLRQCLPFLPPGVRHIAADGAFARFAFVQGATDLGLEIVSKLRPDANVRYRYCGPQKKCGARKLYDGKVVWSDLDLLRWQHEGELEAGVSLYSATLFHVSLKRWVQVALLLPSPSRRKTLRHTLLFSTDLSLSGREIVSMYRARFQIEFLFRDAKSGAGLTHCQSRCPQTLAFHWNAALAALNLAKLGAASAQPPQQRARFSWNSLSQKTRNQNYLQLVSSNLGLDWNAVQNHPNFQTLLNYAVINP